MIKTANKYKTDECERCGLPHENYTGKLDSKGIEYVVCGGTHKRINVNKNWILQNTVEILEDLFLNKLDYKNFLNDSFSKKYFLKLKMK